MELGDTVIFKGERFRLRGIDPFGVRPRFLYLEHPSTGKTVSVLIDERGAASWRRSGGLELVPGPASEPRRTQLVVFVGGMCIGALGVLVVVAAAWAT